MNLVVVITLPFLTALIGWLTNKVAIRMLFRPQRTIKIFGWGWQGLIPRRQTEIAIRIGEIVERELLGQHILRDKIKSIDLRPHLYKLAAQLIRHGLGQRLKQIPLLGALINPHHLTTLENIVAEEMIKRTPGLIDKLAEEAESHLQIRPHIEEQIRGFDLEKLERVVNQVASNEFRTIELMGCVLGFMIGLLQLLFLWLTGNLSL